MILLKNVKIGSRNDSECVDVLVAGKQIAQISKEINISNCEVLDCHGKTMIPGLIDQHVHITGGGGEGGFATKTPEVQLSKLIEGGITTVLGLLGTDGLSRSVENLVSKAKGLKQEGLSVYCTTGAYGYPSPTITGSVAKDILFVEEIIGCKLALSDHRSSHVTEEELTRLASDVRVAGMLSKKAGIITLHMGDEATGLELVRRIVRKTDIPITLFRPTHVSRNPRLLKEAIEFNQQGGMIDFTCGDENHSFAQHYLECKKAGCNMDHITLSSDGQGSWSKFNDTGECIQIGVSSVSALLDELRRMVLDYKIPLDEALCCMTSNVAKSLSIYPTKGCVEVGSDADLVILDEFMKTESVMAQGVWMKKEGICLKKGTFE